MIKIYTMPDCPHCDQVDKDLPADKVEFVDVKSDDYKGFVPPNLPVAQINGINLEGAHVINSITALLK